MSRHADSVLIRVPGKWVLAGEHAVLRGSRAVALPHSGYHLELSFEPDSSDSVQVEPREISHFVGALISRLEEQTGLSLPAGTLRLKSNIPEAAGLGSSAALSVALVEWAERFFEAEIAGRKLELARNLEDYFHGKSSGMDVAVVLKREPILFSIHKKAQPLGVSRLPDFRFSDTGMRSSTSDCVQQNREWFEAHISEGEALDRRMDQASELGARGLVEYSETGSLEKIAQAMNEAHACFENWGLVPEKIASQVRDLRSQGALGVKLTGAGRGGFLVSVWKA